MSEMNEARGASGEAGLVGVDDGVVVVAVAVAVVVDSETVVDDVLSAGNETKVRQNSLLACAKSYVAKSTAASGPGSAANMAFACSGSAAAATAFALFFSLFPNPTIPNAEFHDHVSGKSS